MSHERAFEQWQMLDEERRNPLSDEPVRNMAAGFRAVGGVSGNSYTGHSGADKVEHPAVPYQEQENKHTKI
jgi:hypothetical protein